MKSYITSLIVVSSAVMLANTQLTGQFGSLTLVSPDNFEELYPLLPSTEYSIVLKYDAFRTPGVDKVDPGTIDLTVIPSGGIEITMQPTLSDDECTITTSFKPLVDNVQLLICADDDNPFTFGSKAIFRTGALTVPVEFSRISGTQSNNNVQINWSTAIEVGNESFTVERAFDDSGWEAVGTVEGAGNSIRNLNYSLTDLNPVSGINYYRVKQVDFNGDFDYSETIQVVYYSDKDIELTPNPASISGADMPMLYVYSELESIATVILFDVAGKQISSQKQSVQIGQNRYHIPVSDLNKGIYMVRLHIGDHQSTHKLYIQD